MTIKTINMCKYGSLVSKQICRYFAVNAINTLDALSAVQQRIKNRINACIHMEMIPFRRQRVNML